MYRQSAYEDKKRYFCPQKHNLQDQIPNKELQDQIDNLQGRGRFLSVWDATTGLPTTEPETELPYEYHTGDYYIVGTVGTTNYKPEGTEYTGDASTTVETDEIKSGDIEKAILIAQGKEFVEKLFSSELKDMVEQVVEEPAQEEQVAEQQVVETAAEETKNEGSKCIAACCEEFGQIFYIYAMANNPVLAAPTVASYCIISIILSRIFLKEKLKINQYICIITVVIGIVILGISEGINSF